MALTKADIKELPNSPIGNEQKEMFAEYVSLVMERTPRTTALKQVFPDRYARAVERASGKKSVIDANVRKEINQIERSKYVKGLFQAADKTWWINFLDKKQDIYNMLYKTAMDDEIDTKDKISASRTLLQFLPSAPREDKLEVTHKVQADDFKDKLLSMKRELHDAANNVEVIDVEPEEKEANES